MPLFVCSLNLHRQPDDDKFPSLPPLYMGMLRVALQTIKNLCFHSEQKDKQRQKIMRQNKFFFCGMHYNMYFTNLLFCIYAFYFTFQCHTSSKKVTVANSVSGVKANQYIFFFQMITIVVVTHTLRFTHHSSRRKYQSSPFVVSKGISSFIDKWMKEILIDIEEETHQIRNLLVLRQ